LASDVGDESLIAIWRSIHDQAALARRVIAETLCTEKNPEF